MIALDKENIETAEILLPCNNLDKTLQFFIDKLGFKMESIAPAEKPLLAVISGYGVRIRLKPGNNLDPGSINLIYSELSTDADGIASAISPVVMKMPEPITIPITIIELSNSPS